MKALLAGLLCTSILLSSACVLAQQPSTSMRKPRPPNDLDYEMARPLANDRDLATRAGPGAEYALGLRYETGDGTAIDLPEAIIWYRQAVVRGHAMAMLAVGQMYEAGKGVEQNDAEAARWYRRAAKFESPQAQYNLARMLATGSGVEPDHAKAIGWNDKSARQGFVKAQYNLGAMFAQGRTGVPDRALAYAWFKIAAEAGNTLAQNNLAVLAPSLSTEQLARADRRCDRKITPKPVKFLRVELFGIKGSTTY